MSKSMNEFINEAREILNVTGDERAARAARMLSFFSRHQALMCSELDPDVSRDVNFAFTTFVGIILTAYDDNKHKPDNILELIQGALHMCVGVIQDNKKEEEAN